MRLVTWNVNSVRTRVSRIVDFLQRESVDVLAMQEIKCKPEQFPTRAFEDAGYTIHAHGLNQWNGVAFASRLPMSNIATSFDQMPGFAKGHDGPDAPLEARALGATIDGVRVWSLYVPNGRSLTDPHYDYKLRWLAALADATRSKLTAEPDLPLALVGDFNIIPFDADNGDPDIVPGVSTHVSPAERKAFFALEAAGVSDVVRPLIPQGYTYWDYQRMKFARDQGVRIDFILGSPALAQAVTGASIHREERLGDQPSDHVPVAVDLNFSGGAVAESEEDDTPMIFA